jgi:phospholipid/cholesterol/gamma-HCH transport system substrate-binding protein
MKDSVESKLGIFFAFAIIALLIVLEFAGAIDFHQHILLHAHFKNVQELKRDDSVKMAGVPIGRIQRINLLTNGLADVVMKVQKDAEVKLDSTARLEFTGLMAQYFIALDFGTPGSVPAEEGATLEVKEQPNLSELMGKLDSVATGVENLTRSFSGEKIDNLLGPITDFLKNNQSNLSGTFANIKTTTDRIVAGQGTIGKLINEDALYVSAKGAVSNLENTATNIQDLAGHAREFITNVNYTVTRINSGEGTVGKLVKDDALYFEATGSMTNLHQILLKINHGQGTVGQLINDDSILKNAKVSLQKLDKATESLEDTGPLSVLGTMASSLF